MTQMFSGCAQLTSLNLSYFDTSSVTNMLELFRDCSSLEYLDISYFDFGNLDSFSFMFNGADNIKFINLYNVQNYSTLKEAISGYSNLNKKNNLTVCQSNLIVINPDASYNCCRYNFEINECNIVPTTFLDSNIIYDSTYLNNSLITESIIMILVMNLKKNNFKVLFYLVLK